MFHFANPVGGNKKRTSVNPVELTYHVNSWITMLERNNLGIRGHSTRPQRPT